MRARTCEQAKKGKESCLLGSNQKVSWHVVLLEAESNQGKLRMFHLSGAHLGPMSNINSSFFSGLSLLSRYSRIVNGELRVLPNAPLPDTNEIPQQSGPTKVRSV